MLSGDRLLQLDWFSFISLTSILDERSIQRYQLPALYLIQPGLGIEDGS